MNRDLPMRFGRSGLFILAALAIAAAATGLGLRDTAPSIRAEVLKERVAHLASPALEGRGSGTAGNEMAAQYIAAAFKRAGLKPVGTYRQFEGDARIDNRGYYQPFSFTAGVARGANNRLEATVGGTTERLRPRTEFEPSAVSKAGKAQGLVVFVGYGIESKEPARNDYAAVDVKGKIALLLAGAPTTDPHSPLQESAGTRRKALTARDRGAAALIVVLPRHSDAPQAAA